MTKADKRTMTSQTLNCVLMQAKHSIGCKGKAHSTTSAPNNNNKAISQPEMEGKNSPDRLQDELLSMVKEGLF